MLKNLKFLLASLAVLFLFTIAHAEVVTFDKDYDAQGVVDGIKGGNPKVMSLVLVTIINEIRKGDVAKVSISYQDLTDAFSSKSLPAKSEQKLLHYFSAAIARYSKDPSVALETKAVRGYAKEIASWDAFAETWFSDLDAKAWQDLEQLDSSEKSFGRGLSMMNPFMFSGFLSQFFGMEFRAILNATMAAWRLPYRTY